MSKDLMLMIGSVMPEQMILEALQEAILNHKLLQTNEAKSKVEMYCMLFFIQGVNGARRA